MQQLTITLPDDIAGVIKSMVKEGDYATESEVIRDSLRTFLNQNRHVESWLADHVGPAYDALKAEPSRGFTTKQVRARLAEERNHS